MTKSNRSDSAASAVKAMLDASKDILRPPSYVQLTESAEPYWNDIIRSRARDEWADVDLVVAGQLAQCMADMADEDILLRAEGKVILNARGTLVMNARTAVMDQLARREMALMRTLRLGGASVGDPRDKAGARKIARESEKLRKELEEDDLLAS